MRSSGAIRWPVSRSSPQVLQSDIPIPTTPPQLGQRRALARASAPLGFRFVFGSSWNSAITSAAGAVAFDGPVVEDLGDASDNKGRSNVSRIGPGASGRSKSPEPAGAAIGKSIEPLLPRRVGKSKSPLLGGPLRVGNIVEPGLDSAITESAGPIDRAAGAANLVAHLGHLNLRPAADSGTFSTTPHCGHWTVVVMIVWPEEAELG